MKNTRVYTDIEKNQILEEVKSSGCIAAVARKNGMPVGTIYTWLHKKKPKVIAAKQESDEIKRLKKALSESQLKNQILQELLKKTYQLWPEK